MSRLDELADQLDTIVEELDDLAFAALRAAVADGASERPIADKRITQARRAVQRAAHLVRALDDE